MTKKLLLILIAVGIFLGIFLPLNFGSQNQAQNLQEKEPKKVAVKKVERTGIPKRVIIPAINVDTTVEEVGLDQQGRMDVPSDVNNTGWYKLGPRPGEVGSAVIDGHLDTITGAPSVFYNLTSLKTGDRIEIIDDQNKKHQFSVINGVYYDDSQFPLELVFFQKDKKRLNLITCGGEWDPVTRNYSKRFVIFSEKVESNV